MSQTFEMFEDTAGEYRWRLRAANGEIIADSGEGYASKSGARQATERIRAYAPGADVLEVDNAAFEVYEDAAGQWRWRLVHRNGNILADSGEGYASKSGARDAVDSIRSGVSDADTEDA